MIHLATGFLAAVLFAAVAGLIAFYVFVWIVAPPVAAIFTGVFALGVLFSFIDWITTKRKIEDD